ncbi:hypothetical protein Ae201684P_022447 [Aphanomyces euteiches]|uniref:DUF7769 domain-containing protein n=1 Tax=Aphanomyces euteiches TaxID=100861 RepID=A0A6G0X5Y7_9STRA|nr:hypothetical protein Ae201684_008140 [Aphanomyces euteiches]KAH9074645.1 hypothetical protein Ae201684P_022447 [Aphanomyces euteiches]
MQSKEDSRSQPSSVRSRKLTADERLAFYHFLLAKSRNGKLLHGSISRAANKFGCNRAAIRRIWSQAEQSLADGALVADTSSHMKGNCGRKKKWTHEAIEQAVKHVELQKRQTLRTLAFHSKVPKTTLVRHIQNEARLKKRTSNLKPHLTEDNKLSRMNFALSFVGQNHSFDSMYDTVHVDEKWFYLTKVNGKYYVYDDEDLPTRHIRSKRHMTKVMFLAAVARPRYDYKRREMFDGKLGIWPFVHRVPALRSSVNRPRGTIVTHPKQVNAASNLEMLQQNVVPAIKAKMPAAGRRRTVFIQQDNAGPHSSSVVKAIAAMEQGDGWNIQLRNQPPNSPDFNVLDLGFFNAIQSLQHQSTPSNIDELIGAVLHAFDELPHETLGRTFVTLQKVLEISIRMECSNGYKLPHLKKDGTIEDISTFYVACEESSIVLAWAKLNMLLEDESALEELLDSPDEVAIAS